MKRCPLGNETERAGRQLAGNDRQAVDIHEGLVRAIFGMEVRRVVIIKVHLDDDSVETADLRH